jgi:hypothetical protein
LPGTQCVKTRILKTKDMDTIKDERDYSIKKGKVLSRFTELFFERFKHNPLYRSCYEALIRDADPYEIIEKLIEINDQLGAKVKIYGSQSEYADSEYNNLLNEKQMLEERVAKWSDFEKIASPDVWVKMYNNYQELLMVADKEKFGTTRPFTQEPNE